MPFPTLEQLKHAVNPSPSISITIRQLLDLACGSKENVPIEDGNLIEILRLKDPKEEWVHIEFPGDNSVSKGITCPILWRIGQWRASHEQWKQVREASERRRQESYKQHEWLKQLTLAIERDAGLPSDQARGLAEFILKKPSPLARYNTCKVYGVVIDAPDEEVLRAYQESLTKVVADEGDWPVPTGDEPHNQCPEC